MLDAGTTVKSVQGANSRGRTVVASAGIAVEVDKTATMVALLVQGLFTNTPVRPSKDDAAGQSVQALFETDTVVARPMDVTGCSSVGGADANKTDGEASAIISNSFFKWFLLCSDKLFGLDELVAPRAFTRFGVTAATSTVLAGMF